MTNTHPITVKINTVTFPAAPEPLLRDIDLTVAQGDFILLTGPSGAGKSMLLHTITGAAEKYHNAVIDGTVLINGIDRREIPLPRICRHIGCMFQEPANQIVSMTAAEEVAFGAANLGCSPTEIITRTTEALAYVGLSEMASRSTGSLSGGEAQRLILASILALKAPLLLLDQPGAELDSQGKNELYRHICRLNREQGVTVLLIPDDGCDFSAVANRRWEISGGTVREAAVTVPEKTSVYPTPVYGTPGETLLKMDHVSYRYPSGIEGCTDISLELKAGEFVALLGANGAGKSTLLKTAEGLLKPETGTVTVFGKTYNKKNTAALRRQIGFLFQNPDFQLFTDSVEAELAFGLKNTALSDTEKQNRVAKVLAELDLAACRDFHPQRLSRSQRQKLALGTALIHQPQLIIADEPTAGLSREAGEAILTLLSKQCQRGCGVLLVTHAPALAQKYARRLLYLENHHLVDRPKEEVPSK